MISILFAVVGIVLFGFLFFGALQLHGLQPFLFRDRCQGTAWVRAFPNTRKEAIREYLVVFVDAFEFPHKEMLKFKPDDEILGIYRKLYPSRWIPDALELETLSTNIQIRYGVDLASAWSEHLTLGQLFALTQGERISS